MISHQHKFIFIHIPKNAGTTIEREFLHRAGEINVSEFDKELMPLSLLSREQYLKYHLVIGSRQHHVFASMPKPFVDDYFSFSFVRNPWARVLSEYFYFKKLAAHIQNHKRMLRVPFDVYIKNRIAFVPASHHPQLNQVDWLIDSTGKIAVDFIGRCESLQEDFDTVCSRLGVELSELPSSNSTKHSHYSNYYNAETKDIIYKNFKRDIDTFKYCFENG